jgi:hypothetical protein
MGRIAGYVRLVGKKSSRRRYSSGGKKRHIIVPEQMHDVEMVFIENHLLSLKFHKFGFVEC